MKTRRTALHPERCADRAGGESLAVERLMRKRDVLGGGGEQQRMFADHLARAQRGEADRARPARAGLAVTAALHRLGERVAPAARDGLADRQRRAGGRIDLLAVMGLEDLGIVFAAGSAAAMRSASASTRLTPGE